MQALANFLDRKFQLTKLGTNIQTEFRAGSATFLTMAYILAANPFFLMAAGVPADIAFVGTALAAAIGTFWMGWATNTPMAMAPGMGLNAALAFGVILGIGVTWQVGMAVIVVEALLVLVAVWLGLRSALVKAIPQQLRLAIAGGIGLFLLWLGIEAGGQGWVRTVPIALNNHITFWSPSLPTEITPTMLLTLLGLFLYVVFGRIQALKNARILLSILVTTVVSVLAGFTPMPTSLFSPLRFPHIIGVGDILEVLRTPILYASVFGFFMADFFDTLGTGEAVSRQGKFHDRLMDDPQNLRRFLQVDAGASAISGLISGPPATTYIESAAGVAEGGRSGLTSVFTGLLFLLALPFAGLANVASGTPGATAPALIVIGVAMLNMLRKEIDWSSLPWEMWLAVAVTIITMPFAKSIHHGIGFGFMVFVVGSLVSGRAKNVSPLMYVATVAFAYLFFFAP